MRVQRLQLVIMTALLGIALPIAAYEQTEHAVHLKNLPPGENVLWSDPGDVSKLDFVNGVGGAAGAPVAPLRFIQEETSGTTPKVRARDAQGRIWSVKFGVEAKPSVFCTRLLWACGYTVESEYFIANGKLQGAHGLKRARAFIQADGSFKDARFQLRSDSPKFLNAFNWTWTSNPFTGSRELNGLKVLVMLLSNWDTKDARDLSGVGAAGVADSNLAIFQTMRSGKLRYQYFVSDWGASLGKWGPTLIARSKWNCPDFEAQTPNFVQSYDDAAVRFGFIGKHNNSIVNGVRPIDVQWLLEYLGRVTNRQLRQGLSSSGASPDEIACYLSSLNQRIDELKTVVPHR